jgi:imidazoleglycerol-phosphate dehydratase
MRNVTEKRETKETKISISVNPDGSGTISADCGVPFFDHMLIAMARHGGFDLTCTAEGDLGVDCHHTIEDIGIVLGEALKKVIGDGHGIQRFAHAIIPMDESLATVVLDCGGRIPCLPTFGNKTIGTFRRYLLSISFTALYTRPHHGTHHVPRGRTITTSARQCSRHLGLRWRGVIEEQDPKNPSIKGSSRFLLFNLLPFLGTSQSHLG